MRKSTIAVVNSRPGMFRAGLLLSIAMGVLFLISGISGCAAKRIWSSGSDEFEKADADNPVAKIICLWQPTEGRGLDNLPGRGFAGQIVFLTQGSPTPVSVDGNVRIFLFDDQGSIQEQQRPIHQFDFVDGAWQAHLHKTAWGPSYQLFIPYVRKGHHEAKCELRVRFQPKSGPAVLSEPATVTLAGRSSAEDSPPPAVDQFLEARVSPAAAVQDQRAATWQPKTSRLDLKTPAPKEFESYTVPQ
jgi:hypothetical protein